MPKTRRAIKNARRFVEDKMYVIVGSANSPSTIAATLRLADYSYVLQNGRIVLDGPADDLARNSRMVQNYMGLSGRGQARTEQQI